MHILPIQIRFNDTDILGHINNAVLMEYFDLGKARYLQQAQVACVPPVDDFTIMVVHFDVDFISQVRPTDRIMVASSVEKIGNKSLRFVQHIVMTPEGMNVAPEGGNVPISAELKPLATCHTVMSGYCPSQHTSAVIPVWVHERISAFEGRAL